LRLAIHFSLGVGEIITNQREKMAAFSNVIEAFGGFVVVERAKHGQVYFSTPGRLCVGYLRMGNKYENEDRKTILTVSLDEVFAIFSKGEECKIDIESPEDESPGKCTCHWGGKLVFQTFLMWMEEEVEDFAYKMCKNAMGVRMEMIKEICEATLSQDTCDKLKRQKLI
jgi:hypothetical protein